MKTSFLGTKMSFLKSKHHGFMRISAPPKRINDRNVLNYIYIYKAKSSQQNWKLSDVELLGRCPAGRHTQQGHYAPAPHQFATGRQGKQDCFPLARAYTVSLRQVRTAPYPHSVPVPQFRPDSIPAPYRKTNRNTV